MSKAYTSIIRGLEEIKAHEEGKLKLRSSSFEIKAAPELDAMAIKNLRTELRLSQNTFAQVMGVSKKTVEAWESSRNTPCGSSRRLIDMIRNDTAILDRQKILIFS